jgi:hypothetical protein
MTREVEVNLLQPAGMKELESHAFARPHTDYVAFPERLVTDREEDFLILIQGREGGGADRGGGSGACG